jgi:hypothetical protein
VTLLPMVAEAMRAAVVRRPSSSIYLLVPAESKIGQEILKEMLKS